MSKQKKIISKVIDCTQERCNIARMQETKTGTVSKAHLQCNMCKHFNKDNERQENIERKLLTLIDSNVLHNIIQHNYSQQTKVTLKQFMKDELHTISTKPAIDENKHDRVLPKLITRLANTLTLTNEARNGSAHHDMDQPPTNTNRVERLKEASTTCQCQTTEDHNTQNDNNNKLPIYYQN